jgi:hypothetical protein
MNIIKVYITFENLLVILHRFNYARSVYQPHDDSFLTQTASKAQPATLHQVQRAINQRYVRPVCEANQSLSCNNETGKVDRAHAFSLAGGAEVEFHIFTAASLLSDSFSPVNSIPGTHWTGERVGPKTAMNVLDKEQTFYSLGNRIPNILMYKTLTCDHTEQAIAVSIRNTNGIRAVDLLYGRYI